MCKVQRCCGMPWPDVRAPDASASCWKVIATSWLLTDLVMWGKNKRENKAIRGKSGMITICFGNIIPGKKRIFVFFSLAGSVHGGGWTQRLWSISPCFNLLNRKVLIWLNHLRRSLLLGTFFGKPKGEEGCHVLRCAPPKSATVTFTQHSSGIRAVLWDCGKAQIDPALQCSVSHRGTGPREQLDTFLSQTSAFGKRTGCSRAGLLTAYSLAHVSGWHSAWAQSVMPASLRHKCQAKWTWLGRLHSSRVSWEAAVSLFW